MCLLHSNSLPKFHLHIIITSKYEVVAYQSSKVIDLNLQEWSWSHRVEVYMGDLKYELEVRVRANPHQRSLRGSELSLIPVVRFITSWFFLL